MKALEMEARSVQCPKIEITGMDGAHLGPHIPQAHKTSWGLARVPTYNLDVGYVPLHSIM